MAVLKCAAKRPLPGFARAGLLAAAFLHGRAMGKQMAALPHATPKRLETPSDAAERPSSCHHHGAPLVPTGGVG